MYHESIVTFIDILGFSSLVQTLEAEQIEDKLNAVTNFAAREPSGGEFEREFDPKVVQFSDCVVRVRPVDTGLNAIAPFGVLFHELIDLLLTQVSLIEAGVLIRGGISYGQVHCEGETVFGPAMIDAYSLESRFANYPRIVVSPMLLDQLHTNHLLIAQHHDLNEELRYIDGLLATGSDGLAFIDYGRAVYRELDEPSDYPRFLEIHRDLINENTRNFNHLDSISAKYLWLGQYHNECVDSLPSETFDAFGYDKDALRVEGVVPGAL